MLQSFLPKLLKEKSPEDTLVPPLRGKVFFLIIWLFIHAAARGGTCAFTLKIVNTLVKNSSRHDRPSIRHRTNPRPTRFVSGKASECWWRHRRYQVDPWSRGREVCPRRPTLLSQTWKKNIFFAIGEGSRFFVACFRHSRAQTCFYQTPGRHPPRITGFFCEHCDQRVGRSPQRARPVQISWRSRWFCRSMSVEDSGSRRF